MHYLKVPHVTISYPLSKKTLQSRTIIYINIYIYLLYKYLSYIYYINNMSQKRQINDIIQQFTQRLPPKKEKISLPCNTESLGDMLSARNAKNKEEDQPQKTFYAYMDIKPRCTAVPLQFDNVDDILNTRNSTSYKIPKFSHIGALRNYTYLPRGAITETLKHGDLVRYTTPDLKYVSDGLLVLQIKKTRSNIIKIMVKNLEHDTIFNITTCKYIIFYRTKAAKSDSLLELCKNYINKSSEAADTDDESEHSDDLKNSDN